MPSKSRRPNREEVRASILQTVRDIAATEGWQCVTVRKVAERIGYTAPIIYEHFGSKDVMLTEILKVGNEVLFDTLKETVKKYEAPGDKLTAMATAYWDFAHTSTELYLLMHGMAGANVPDRQGHAFGAPIVKMVSEELIRFNPKRINAQNVEAHVVEMWSMCHGIISLSLSGYVSQYAEGRMVLETAVSDMLYALQNNPAHPTS
jgi:AcrR family transcriptional regulator